MSPRIVSALCVASLCILAPLALVACSDSHDAPGTDAGSRITFDAELPPDGTVPGTDAGTDASFGPGAGMVGAPCTSDTDCPDGACLEDPSFAPGGYCTRSCAAGEPCPDGSLCVELGGGTALCLDSCDPTSGMRECRTGYGCASSPFLPGPVCIGGCTDDTDCPGGACDTTAGTAGAGACYTPDGMVGAACESDAACPMGAFCLTEDADGWPAGSCILPGCDGASGTGCSGDAVCIPINPRTAACFDGCATDMDCRAGYRCAADSTLPGRSYCQPGCTSDAQCSGGRVCNRVEGTCLPPFVPSELGQACSGDPAACAGGACFTEFGTGFPGSYCVAVGCTPGATPTGCPGDGVCRMTADGSSYCLDGCTSDANCRDGYACRPSDPTMPSSATACMPACTADADCSNMGFACNNGTGLCTRPFDPSLVGDACTGGRTCIGGTCLTETATGWPGGTCAYPGCRLSGMGPAETCPMGSVCVDDLRGDPTLGWCITACTVGTSGACRSGYACVALTMGGTDGACRPACTASSMCTAPNTCDTMTGLCE